MLGAVRGSFSRMPAIAFETRPRLEYEGPAVLFCTLMQLGKIESIQR